MKEKTLSQIAALLLLSLSGLTVSCSSGIWDVRESYSNDSVFASSNSSQYDPNPNMDNVSGAYAAFVNILRAPLIPIVGTGEAVGRAYAGAY